MKHLKQKLLVAVGFTVSGVTATAAIPAGVEASFTTAGTDAATVIGYATLAAVAMVAALWVKRAIFK